jgi:hypothetical protein
MSFGIHNHTTAPVRIIGWSTDLEGGRITRLSGNKPLKGTIIAPGKFDMVKIHYPRWPQIPRGPFKRSYVLETDCPGYERVEGTITGDVQQLYVEGPSAAIWRGPYGGAYSTKITLWNASQQAVTLKSVSCTLPGATVELPAERTMPVAPRRSTGEKPVIFTVSVAEGEAPVEGSTEGRLVLETDLPGYEKYEVPIVIRTR